MMQTFRTLLFRLCIALAISLSFVQHNAVAVQVVPLATDEHDGIGGTGHQNDGIGGTGILGIGYSKNADKPSANQYSTNAGDLTYHPKHKRQSTCRPGYRCAKHSKKSTTRQKHHQWP